MTETRSDAGPSGVATASPPGPTAPNGAVLGPMPGGLAGIVGTGDHKTIGRLYIGFSLLFLAVALGAGLSLGFERLDTSSLSLLENAYEQVFTLHGIAAIFLFLIPLALGLAIYVVPLQVGASTVAFPRAAAASLWGFVVSGGLLLASYAINGGPYGGDEVGVDLFLVSFGALIGALLLGAICVAATVLTLRTAGMSLDRVPLFSWSMLVAATMWVLTLPVLLGMLILLYLDHRYGQVIFGGSTGIYPRIVWAVVAPQVFTFAVPALGILGDVVAMCSGRRMPGRNVMMDAIAAVGILGFGAWTMLVATGGDKPVAINGDRFTQPLFIVMSFAIVLPMLAALGGTLDTLRRGRPKLASPLLFTVFGLLLILGGAAATAVSAVDSLDLRGTTWEEGQQHLVLVGAALALFGGLAYWAPKIWGRMVRSGAGSLAALLGLAGGALYGVGDLVSGALDQPTFTPIVEHVRGGVDFFNLLSFVGLILVALAAVIVVLTLLGRGGELADDPWNGRGQTLEWATASPPPLGNFAVLAEVTSPEPLLDVEGTGTDTQSEKAKEGK